MASVHLEPAEPERHDRGKSIHERIETNIDAQAVLNTRRRNKDESDS